MANNRRTVSAVGIDIIMDGAVPLLATLPFNCAPAPSSRSSLVGEGMSPPLDCPFEAKGRPLELPLYRLCRFWVESTIHTLAFEGCRQLSEACTSAVHTLRLSPIQCGPHAAKSSRALLKGSKTELDICLGTSRALLGGGELPFTST